MKKMFLSAAVILAIGATAFTVKAHNFGQTTVYCETSGSVVETCPGSPLDDVIVDNTLGTIVNPCTPGLTPHRQNGTTCEDRLNSDLYKITDPGK